MCGAVTGSRGKYRGAMTGRADRFQPDLLLWALCMSIQALGGSGLLITTRPTTPSERIGLLLHADILGMLAAQMAFCPSSISAAELVGGFNIARSHEPNPDRCKGCSSGQVQQI